LERATLEAKKRKREIRKATLPPERLNMAPIQNLKAKKGGPGTNRGGKSE